MPLSLQWSSGAAKSSWCSRESLPSHSSRGRTLPRRWSWSSGGAGGHRLGSWEHIGSQWKWAGVGDYWVLLSTTDAPPPQASLISPIANSLVSFGSRQLFWVLGGDTFTKVQWSCLISWAAVSLSSDVSSKALSATCKVNELAYVFSSTCLLPLLGHSVCTLFFFSFCRI